MVGEIAQCGEIIPPPLASRPVPVSMPSRPGGQMERPISPLCDNGQITAGEAGAAVGVVIGPAGSLRLVYSRYRVLLGQVTRSQVAQTIRQTSCRGGLTDVVDQLTH